MEKMTLLDKREISKYEYQLSCMKKLNRNAIVTDFCILLGVNYTPFTERVDDEEGIDVDERIGEYWTKSNSEEDYFCYISNEGSWENGLAYLRDKGIRPVFDIDKDSDFPMNKGSRVKFDKEGNQIVEYGYYPQTIASKDMINRLEKEFNKKGLRKTRNEYVTDGVPKRLDEYLDFKPN